MIKLMDMLSFFLTVGYTFLFFSLLRAFLPLRGSLPMQAVAFAVCSYLADFVIYANDPAGLLSAMALFLVYVLLFYKGRIVEKLSALLIFYPALVAVNYLMLDIGSRMFFHAMPEVRGAEVFTSHQLWVSTFYHTVSLLIRLLFWVGVWWGLRRPLAQLTTALDLRMWLIVDTLGLAAFVAIFTILCFMPEDTAIAYPICGASLFSSFGCMYLASYISGSLQTAYRAQELEVQHRYYEERLKEEERVRSIYHDLKNHLLILQAEGRAPRESEDPAGRLLRQIEGYENYMHTGNDFLDIILRNKARDAQEKQIDFSASVHFEDGGFIDPLDISTIFGNALDNAIEASGRLPIEERIITLKTVRVRDMLSIVVENNALPSEEEGQSAKPDRFLHGFGLPNIRKAVEKYGGQCVVGQGAGLFTLKALIPIP